MSSHLAVCKTCPQCSRIVIFFKGQPSCGCRAILATVSSSANNRPLFIDRVIAIEQDKKRFPLMKGERIIY